MPHPRKTSQIARILDEQLAAAHLPDTDLGLSPCKVANAACELSPGIEHLFVTMTANYLVDRIRAKIDPSWQSQELVYCPHQTIEKKCGFDLSIGHFQRPNRIRSMHKLHFGTKQIHPWPDEDWMWSTLDGNADERDRIKHHLLLLLGVYSQRDYYEPFLILHLCFCIHEYRRMKTDEPEQVIPSFTDPRRTVVVDLRPLAKVENYEALIKAPAFAIRIEHEHKTGKTEAKLVGIAGHDSLPVMTLKKLGDRAVERVGIEFREGEVPV